MVNKLSQLEVKMTGILDSVSKPKHLKPRVYDTPLTPGVIDSIVQSGLDEEAELVAVSFLIV
jgi:hypothetical protein